MFLVTTNTQHIALQKSVNVFTSGLQMWVTKQSLQISTPSAVQGFNSVVGRKPATAPLFHEDLASSICVILLTNKQADKSTFMDLILFCGGN